MICRSGSEDKEEIIELVDVGAPNLWGHFMDMMRFVGRRRGGAAKEIFAGGIKW